MPRHARHDGVGGSARRSASAARFEQFRLRTVIRSLGLHWWAPIEDRTKCTRISLPIREIWCNRVV